jgi:protection of telomeres protein 1
MTQPSNLLSDLLEPVYDDIDLGDEKQRVGVPFVCINSRVHVRVVDFHPSRLEDFAVARQQTESDIFSDTEPDSASNSSSDDEDHAPNEPKIWEWRFSLLLEDASPRASQPPARVWAAVSHHDAQLLTRLDDPANLRRNPELLAALRDALFSLWGDLEEKKRAEEEARRQRRRQGRGGGPPAHSDDEAEGETATPGSSQVRNKPFACCLRQYGFKNPVKDAETGEVTRVWRRMFGLFGTQITPG